MGRWITTQVDILSEDILDQLKDDELLAEIKSRDIGHGQDLLEELRRADPKDFLTIAERMLAPKWPGTKACKEQYELEMGR